MLQHGVPDLCVHIAGLTLSKHCVKKLYVQHRVAKLQNAAASVVTLLVCSVGFN